MSNRYQRLQILFSGGFSGVFIGTLVIIDSFRVQDWWNQSTFSSYYRTWNVLVQDWLYTYVYKDVLLLGGNALTGRLLVFGISAVAHEFILGFTMRFFYPALYVFFGVIGCEYSPCICTFYCY